ncbi:SDR family NAD(P)-dependent oxidoreductase [Amycolatopsis sp. H20-H5]|uniref:SDR family NAD(P)-dependent oxidoreductase n=1 Tax=Amycolatopsis sp. H20-H5 TaxID=3046309 RepID=UPI002DBAD952|nr:SDR family NAD(P)-dependent oxidoreductase [Amycolatopsis sp. H20-H5]MEC3975732.1 SDR family NAD(P)-dependent oxidoreductase [Amycolatopsis sp. H20-H5]
MLFLITGANKGLGYEAARRLIEAGHQVIVGARNPELGQAAADTLGAAARFVPLDVTDDASVKAAAENVTANEGHLDGLINNAGVSGPRKAVDDLTAADAVRVYDTNVFGIIRVTSAFLPLLRKSGSPVIVNVSSGLGSFEQTHREGSMEARVVTPIYASSKAAVSMLTSQYAKALPEIVVNAVDPGFTNTDLTGGAGVQTVTEGTDAIVATATIGPGGPTGTFRNRLGEVGW